MAMVTPLITHQRRRHDAEFNPERDSQRLLFASRLAGDLSI
jgi:hypothetical protein